MSRKIIVRESARRDTIAIFVYIGEDNLHAADRFLENLRETFHLLSQFPEMGKLRKFTHSFLSNVRSWPVKDFDNYLIFYRSIQEDIEILHIFHGSRDIDSLFEDSSEFSL